MITLKKLDDFFVAVGTLLVKTVVVGGRSLALLLILLVLWKSVACAMLPGPADTQRITFRLGGYQADIPNNYIVNRAATENPQGNKPFLSLDTIIPPKLAVILSFFSINVIPSGPEKVLSLWTYYPTFEGYTKARGTQFTKSHEDVDSPKVTFGILYNNDLHLEANAAPQRKIQSGKKELAEEALGRGYVVAPLDQQPFSNPIRYIDPVKKKDMFLFDAGDHAVLIFCTNNFYPHKPESECKASKLWGNFGIGLIYQFSIFHLKDFGRIESGIDKLLNSFNIRELTVSKPT